MTTSRGGQFLHIDRSSESLSDGDSHPPKRVQVKFLSVVDCDQEFPISSPELQFVQGSGEPELLNFCILLVEG